MWSRRCSSARSRGPGSPRPAPQTPCVGVLGLLTHMATTVTSSRVYSLPVLQVRGLTWSQGLRSGRAGRVLEAPLLTMAISPLEMRPWLSSFRTLPAHLGWWPLPPPAELSPRPSRFLCDSLWLAPPISDSASCSLIRTLVTTCRATGIMQGRPAFLAASPDRVCNVTSSLLPSKVARHRF